MICDFDGPMVMVMELMTMMMATAMTVMVLVNDGDGDVGDCGGLDELFMAPPPPISCLSHLTPDSTFGNQHNFEERRLKREIVHPPINRKTLNFFQFWTTCLKARM